MGPLTDLLNKRKKLKQLKKIWVQSRSKWRKTNFWTVSMFRLSEKDLVWKRIRFFGSMQRVHAPSGLIFFFFTQMYGGKSHRWEERHRSLMKVKKRRLKAPDVDRCSPKTQEPRIQSLWKEKRRFQVSSSQVGSPGTFQDLHVCQWSGSWPPRTTILPPRKESGSDFCFRLCSIRMVGLRRSRPEVWATRGGETGEEAVRVQPGHRRGCAAFTDPDLPGGAAWEGPWMSCVRSECKYKKTNRPTVNTTLWSTI